MTAWVLYLVFGSLAVVSIWLFALQAIAAHSRYRGIRILKCPRDDHKAAVAIRPWKAALPTVFGNVPVLQVIDCSRWPEQCECDQRCLSQITLAPEETLLRSILSERYTAQPCAFCGTPFRGERDWLVPALVAADGSLVDVVEVPPDRIEETISTHEPVCVRCYGQMSLRPGQRAFFASSRRVGTL